MFHADLINTPSTQSHPQDDFLTLAHLLSGQISPANIPLERWPSLMQSAFEQRVFTPIYEQYRTVIPAQAADPAFAQIEFRQRTFSMQMQWMITEIEQVFAAHHMPIIWLKGVILAYTVYDHPWQRYMRDLDFLVPYERRHEALQILKNMGFIHTAAALERYEERYVAHYQLNYKDAENGLIVEAHFRLLKYETQPLLVDHQTWFYQRTQSVKTSIGELMSLSPEAMFLHLVLHDIFQHEGHFPDIPPKMPPQLRRKYDLYLFLQRETLNFDLVIADAKTLDCLYAVAIALEEMQQYFGMDFTTEIARCKADAQYPLRFDYRERNAYVNLTWLISVLLAPRQLVAYFRRISSSSPKGIRETLRMSESQPVYRYHYAARILRRIGRFFAALPRLAVGMLRMTAKNQRNPTHSL